MLDKLKKDKFGTTVQPGYLPCNGQEVSIRPYSYSDCGYSDYIISNYWN